MCISLIQNANLDTTRKNKVSLVGVSFLLYCCTYCLIHSSVNCKFIFEICMSVVIAWFSTIPDFKCYFPRVPIKLLWASFANFCITLVVANLQSHFDLDCVILSYSLRSSYKIFSELFQIQ